jgi:hypothetical protein
MIKFVDYYFIYKFVKMLVTPFKKTDAYKLGIIDENGNILKPMDELNTSQEKKAYSYTNRLVWNLKKLLGKFPFGKSTLASFGAAVWLLKEDGVIKDQYYIEEELKTELAGEFPCLLEEDFEYDYIDKGSYTLKHNLDPNSSVGDRILVLNNQPIDKLFGINIFECINIENDRYLYLTSDFLIENGMTTTDNIPDSSDIGPNKFAGVHVFDVSSDTFMRCIKGKKKYARWKNYLNDEDESDVKILNYAKSNPNNSVILKNDAYGGMIYLRKYTK